ncbi:hypothetical protein UFOVP903_53 [uncultured Caudovirales phage]|uniref:Uncharacterized protein n=1 Tax=uncultured Caudovirales phage TaxID=2100421 RepID=A0A6J5SB10_9CAUD|nr:hypothetical protein UFOVP903_53 [uncultured Caudovirales phage]CAB4198049.1 hypothetical protein UFOVP1318_51 [uncultured Caudovirales phage]CAB4210860.1 hypothetical protein UFOVP1430_51 [uncultured Caudovirales phage]
MAAVVDLNGIKESIQTLLTSANTTTSTPVDLSNGLSGGRRVQQVLKVHPERIRVQASLFPLVTCFIPTKSIKSEQIGGGQLNNKRRATIEIKVVGAIWNSNFQSIDEDPADEDICNLMENIELALRSDSTLIGKVNWQRPSSCQYYSTAINEQTHLRSGILTYECEVFY